MTIVSLATNNFSLQGKKLLLNSGEADFLVLFKAKGADADVQLIHVLSQDQRVNYGILDLASNPTLVRTSQNSTTPLVSPNSIIIFYHNGNPFAKFSGAKNPTSLQKFISSAINAYSQSESAQFVPPPQPQQKPGMYGGPAVQLKSTGGGSGKIYRPEGLNAPSTGSLRGGIANSIPDDDNTLLVPENIIPKSTPWQADI